jgi:Putative adhesin
MPPPLPMTPGRRVALAIGVPVALAIIGLTALTIVANVGQASLRVDQAIPAPDHLVRVTIDNPDVTLRSAAGSGAGIRVTGTLRGPFVPPAFRVLPTAAGVAIRSRCVMKIVGSCSGALTLTAPAGLPVTVSDASGHLSASGVHGHVTLSDGSGEIVVTGLAETDVVARNGSGDVTLIFTKVPRRVDITDGSGNITLALPPGPAYYRVDASSSSGDRSVSVKTRPSSPYVIAATADSGNVSISYG